VLRNIVDRAKLYAVTRARDIDGILGLRVRDLLQAAVEEILAIEDLTGTTNPDDWARISGRKGERITYMRTMVRRGNRFVGRSIDVVRGNYRL
jgi:proteasome-associated ATPase